MVGGDEEQAATARPSRPDPSPQPSPEWPSAGESRSEWLKQAAYDAERATGEWEATKAKAKRNIIVRLTVITIGTLVTLTGLALLVLPGPGLVVVIAGLGILSTEVTWAERLLAYAKERARLDEITAQRPWVKPVSIVVTVVGVAVSLIYMVRWR